MAKTMPQVGDDRIDDVLPAISPHLFANGRDITFPDGKKLFMGSSGTGAPRDGRDPTEPPK